ncbi:DUF3397 family protein [Apilactobacillus apisilvae]|uniref:DUF3397 family protein n=1 Tax=Apilactobacillus apisilvae TaxID=2923364 RepID=UPI0037BF568B
MIISPFLFLSLILFQIVLLFIVSLIFTSIKSIVNKYFPNNLSISDFFPLINGFYIYQISLNKNGTSYLPLVLFIWVILGIILGIFYLFRSNDANIIKFYKLFWKLGIIYMFLAWILTIFIYGYQIL